MIKAVFLDVDNTLLDFHECAKSSMKSAMKDFGLEYREEMFPVFVTINDSLWSDIERGVLTRDGLAKIRWNTIFKTLGITANGVEFETVFSNYLWQSADTVPYAGELLKYLSGKYRVCITSNAVQEQQVTRLTNAGLMRYIDNLFTSGLIGSPKPSRGFFDGCFERLKNIGREEVIVIGDSLTADIKGGIDYGLKTCWFNYAGVTPPKSVKPDYTVDSLEEITKIL